MPGSDIDHNKNISRFVLQYQVDYGGKNKGKVDEFDHFTLQVITWVTLMQLLNFE